MSDVETTFGKGALVTLGWDLDAMTARIEGLRHTVNGVGSVGVNDVLQRLDSLSSYLEGVMAGIRSDGFVL